VRKGLLYETLLYEVGRERSAVTGFKKGCWLIGSPKRENDIDESSWQFNRKGKRTHVSHSMSRISTQR